MTDTDRAAAYLRTIRRGGCTLVGCEEGAHPQDDARLPRSGAADVHRAGNLARRRGRSRQPELVMAAWNLRTEANASAGIEAMA